MCVRQKIQGGKRKRRTVSYVYVDLLQLEFRRSKRVGLDVKGNIARLDYVAG
jgi:hypothetical protein